MPITQVRSKQQFLVTDDVNFQGFRATNLADPVAAQDAATKAYVDAVKQALDIKDSVRVATTANITLSGTQTIDGVAVLVGDRVLVKDQSLGQNNGIYVVASSTWSRAVDADTSADINSGMFVFVEEGTINGDNGFVLTTNGPITLGTTILTFTQFSGAGQVVAGDGLTKTGNTINAVGSSGRIVVNPDNIDLATVSAGSTAVSQIRKLDFDSYGRLSQASNAVLADIITTVGSVSANTVFAGPNGSAGSASFRTLVENDIPNLSAAKITSGTLAIARGGTGLGTIPTNGQLLIGNGTGYSLATLTAGSGISVSNGSGTITIGNTGVLSVTAVTNQTTVSASTGAITIGTVQDIGTASTPTFGGANINGTLNLRASASASAVTQVPVFTADPASVTRTLVTRTPSQFLTDIGGVTQAGARSAISLTTTGTSGAATYNSGTGVLNIPNYSVAGLGAVPTSRTLTIVGTTNRITVSPTGAQSLANDISWTLDLPQDIHSGATPTFLGLSLVGGTVIVSNPLINATQIWNAVAQDFTALFLNVTDSGSTAGSLLLDLRVGNTTRFAVRKDGTITAGTWEGSVITAIRGGTGQSSYATGDILFASSTTDLSRLAAATTGNVLLSGTTPSWGKVGLTTHVSGVLPIANGGTNLNTTPSNGQILIGNGTAYSLSTITGGTGITVTNGSGTITVAVNTTNMLAKTDYIVRETPTGTINGTNAIFTLANTPISATEQVFVNGILMNSGASNDYTISGATITFLSGAIPQSGDVIRVTYIR